MCFGYKMKVAELRVVTRPLLGQKWALFEDQTALFFQLNLSSFLNEAMTIGIQKFLEVGDLLL